MPRVLLALLLIRFLECHGRILPYLTPSTQSSKLPSVRGSYTIRDIDPRLWVRVKVKAAQQNVSIKDLILRLLREWAS